MEITVGSITDNEDGSCNVVFNMDPEVLKSFASQAIRDALICAAHRTLEDTDENSIEEVDEFVALLEEIDILENKLERANQKNFILYNALNLISIGKITDNVLIKFTASEALDKVDNIGKEDV